MKRYEATAGQIWTLKANNGSNRAIMILAVTLSNIATINVVPWEPHGKFMELEELIVPKEVGLEVPSVAKMDSVFNNRLVNLVEYIGTVDREYYSDVVHAISDYYLGRIVLDESRRCFTYPSRSRRYIYDDYIASKKQIKVEEPKAPDIIEPETETTPEPVIKNENPIDPDTVVSDIILLDELSNIRKAIKKHFEEDGFTTLSLNGYRPDKGVTKPRQRKPTISTNAPASDIYNNTFTEEMVSDILTLPVTKIAAKFNINYTQVQYLRSLLRSYLGLGATKHFINFPDDKDCDDITIEELEELNPGIPRIKLTKILNRRRIDNNNMKPNQVYMNRKPKFTWSFTFNREEIADAISTKSINSITGIVARMDEYMYDLKDKINSTIITIDFSDLALSEDELAVKYGFESGTELAREFHIMASRAFYKVNRGITISISDEIYLEFANLDNGNNMFQFCKDTLSYPKSIYTQARKVLAKCSAANIEYKDLSYLSSVTDIIREIDRDAIVFFDYITKSRFMENYNISEYLYSNLSHFVNQIPSNTRNSLSRMMKIFTTEELIYAYTIQDVLYSSFISAKYADIYNMSIYGARRVIYSLIGIVYDVIVLDDPKPDIINSINICKDKEYEFQKNRGMKRISKNVTRLLNKLSEI